MFTLGAFSQSQDSAALIATAALADPHLTINGNDLRIPGWASKLSGWYALGPNVTLAQLRSPSLLRTLPIDITPLDVSAVPTNIKRVPSVLDRFIDLDVDESLNALMAENAAGASRVTIMVWLSDGRIEPFTGEIFTVRCTSATAVAANAWSNVPLTFGSVLPAGKYAVVGARGESTNMQAFRFVFTGFGHRPGTIATPVVSDLDVPGARYGGWGKWGEFYNTTPPTIDVLANGADATQVFFLDLVQLS